MNEQQPHITIQANEYEQAHDILVLIVLRSHSLNMQAQLPNVHIDLIAGLNPRLCHKLWTRAAKTQARLRISAGSSELSLLVYAISTKISCNIFNFASFKTITYLSSPSTPKVRLLAS